MSQRTHAALIIAAALTVTGCSSGAPAQRVAATATATAAAAAASPSRLPGCAQATAAVLAARESISAQDYAGATTRISDLRDALPAGKLKVDAALAATDLAFLNYDVTAGEPVYQAVKDAQASLGKISADCGA